MWLGYEPVDSEYVVQASQAFGVIWPRSSEAFWQDVHVKATDITGMIAKLRDDFVANIAQLSPEPNKSGWSVLPPLQSDIWVIGHKGHTCQSTVEYEESGATHQWTMDYGGPSSTAIIVHAEWQEVRQL